MITEFHIKNFKSIAEHTLELGRTNVFIGENGSGKTNILEAIATMGAAISNKLSIEELYTRGVRIAKPSIMISSFSKTKTPKKVDFSIQYLPKETRQGTGFGLSLSPMDEGAIGATWNLASYDFSHQLARDVAEALRKQASALDSSRSSANPEPTINLADLIMSQLPQSARALESFCIYDLNPLALRGIHNVSRRTPLGINGENLDVFLSALDTDQLKKLEHYCSIISWFDRFIVDTEDELKFKGHKLGRSTSRLYFQDRFMRKGNNIFSAENANEGILHILFYLALFLSDKTPSFFGIDNIETALNPQLCRELMKALAAMAKEHGKQTLITTHNPAILDGLNLHDEEQRLFVVYRNDEGQTTTRRVKVKPEVDGAKYKLSELWMRGHLGGIPKAF
ncbi:recombinase RecF [Corallococcus sp. CA054B]|uniref:AAA family ATPase n=1 Tax=Corallococcus sp. CA054B TaxID=2316734 RepID=UPI000EA078A1|nr:AAA family ATPase [Corallococcus sp. CA054B]RKG59182.1 recombinase RecF [Corallococcus sp. CA054B]